MNNETVPHLLLVGEGQHSKDLIIMALELAVGYTGPKNFFFWCDVLCMSFGHRKQENKFFLKNFHFWRLALPKTGENREIRDFWWFFG